MYRLAPSQSVASFISFVSLLRRLVVLATIFFLPNVTALVHAQEQEDQRTESPTQATVNEQPNHLSAPDEFELLFEDDFSSDSLAEYQIVGPEGKVRWNPGRITFEAGGAIKRDVAPCGWIDVDVDLWFDDIDEGNRQSVLTLMFLVPSSTPCILQFSQLWNAGDVESTIAVCNIFGASNFQVSELVREFTDRRRLPSGRWRISYRYGLWKISAPDGVMQLHAHIEKGIAPVETVMWHQGESASAISQLRVTGHRQFTQPLSDEQQNQLAEAMRLNQQVIEISRNGNHERAIELARKVTDIRSKILGQFHPD
ncbi:MAG TPA: hypothetical protein PKD64_19985 [Pirellulaceae bacterium]|nr:hypothetical protein [Pirellulaceae bacterium]HMO94470.1 hypothetical protein [Pirellulaceae bacterium]